MKLRNGEEEKKIFKYKYIGILMIFLIVLFFGVSYALFGKHLTGEKKYIIDTGGLKVYLDESETSSNVSLTDSLPVLDEDGMKNTPYKFSLVNEENQDLTYTIYLAEDELANKTPSNMIRYYYTRDVENIKVIRGMTEQQTEDGRFYLESGVLPAKSSYHYTFCMWLSYEATNEAIGTQYSIHLEVDTKQSLFVYKDEALNGCDPVLTPNLVPVMIESDGTVKKASSGVKWYDYANRLWANAVVLIDDTKEYGVGDTIPEANIQSYFVWIPRYKYKLFNMGNYTSLTSITNAVQTIDVVFESKDVTPSVGTKVGDYHSHPAFQAFDSNGFWVGKFESGYKGATTTAGAQQNNSNPSNLVIKPNVYSWRYITVGNAFKASYDYMRNEESHMMKNTEWGAVALLQHSEYGSRASVRVNNNNSYLTGYASVSEPTCGPTTSNVSSSCNPMGTDATITQKYNTPTGYTASTTGNISGIYDMAGGAWEYVMGYNTKANSVGGSSALTTIYGDFFSSKEWEKYYDKYSSTSDVMYNARILGDATGEMGGFANVTAPNGSAYHTSSWYGDYGYFATAASPWFVRGGNWGDGSMAGVFTFYGHTGGVHTAYSFRVVLAL